MSKGKGALTSGGAQGFWVLVAADEQVPPPVAVGQECYVCLGCNHFPVYSLCSFSAAVVLAWQLPLCKEPPGEKHSDKPMMWLHGACPERVYHLKCRLLRLESGPVHFLSVKSHSKV